MESKLEEARALARENRYELAMSNILKALPLCTCKPVKPHGKDKSCNIRQCISAVKKPDVDDLWKELQSNKCRCGQEWPVCTQSIHTEAVDELAACLEKAGRYVAAFSTALGLIRMHPASPVGYCRIVKIIRLLISKRSEPDVARSLSVVIRDAKLSSAGEFADLVKPFIRCGLHNSRAYGEGPETKYHMVLRRMAHSMGMDEAKRDVVRKLPRELMSLVFSFLDLTTLCRCKRVSKEWLQILISDQAAWANIHLNRPRNPGRSFEKFLKYRPGIRSLIIEDVQDFGLSTNRVATLCGLRGLKRLHFGNAKKGYAFPSPGPKNMLALQLPHRLCELTHLSLRFTEARNFLITDLISVFRETLEDINVVSGSVHHLAAFSVNMPFPRLKRLRLAVHVEDICPIELDTLSCICPNLEELYLNGFMIKINIPSTFHPAESGQPTHWLNLRRLVFGPLMKRNYLTDARIRYLPPILPSLEHVEFLSPDALLIYNCFFVIHHAGANLHADDGHPDENCEYPYQYSTLPKLKTLRCHSAIPPNLLQHLIGDAVKEGVLETLELSIRDDSVENTSTAYMPRPAEAYAFTVGDSVKHIGLYDFNWAPPHHYSSFDGEPFFTWLAMFKNVETVALYPGAYPGVGSMAMRIMKEFPTVKVIYQDRLEGIDWDHARTLAKKHDVELKHVKGHAPVVWSGYEAW